MNKVLLSSQFYYLMLSANTQPIACVNQDFKRGCNRMKPTPPHVKNGRGKRKGRKK